MSDPSPPSGPPVGARAGRLLVGRYRLDRALAAGGMAEVWEGTDQTLGRRVAIKVLHPHLARDDSFVRRFRAEALAAARLSHPSIVSVYDTFTDDGVEAIVMELVSGTTLRADLDQHGPMRLDAVLAVGTQVADALGAAHAAGLVHRDVKPANILLSADGRVLVADFGIAKAAEGGDLTTAGAMVGTAKYLAPEQVQGGPLDGRADLYSLGVVLYEALTGVPPFVEETDAAPALARLHRDPVPPRQRRPEIPSAVEAVVLQAMARDRALRFANAAALRTALLSAGADPRRAAAVAAEANHPSNAAVPPPPGAGPAPAPIGSSTPAPTAPPRPASPAPVTASPAPGPPPPAPSPSPAAAPPQPAAPPSVEGPDAEPAGAGRRRRSRAWLLAFGGLVVAFAIVAFVATNGSTAGAEPLQLASASSFDPQGDNKAEREDLVANAIDGNPSTTWRSEHYTNPETMAGKDGVGLAVHLDGSHAVRSVQVATPEGGWSAAVYVAPPGDRPALADWGQPIASVAGAGAGTTTFDTGGAPGSQVLVWFTRLPASGAVQVSEVTVHGR
ncbi:MAG: serine/threonine-protein kinase [Acidimicrobiales bacterium]